MTATLMPQATATTETVPGSPILQAQRLSRAHGRRRRRVTVLDRVTLTVQEGEFVAVMGESGSGKTTLLHCLGGLDRPDAGHVLIDGTDITRLREAPLTRWRRQHIGIVFQDYNLLPSLTVMQNVMLPARLGARGVSRSRARELLREVGLNDRLQHRAGALSGGERQRAALARALVTSPRLLLADEPTGALDRHTADVVLRLLREQIERRGTTTVMVTHDPVSAAWADRVVMMRDGVVVDATES